MTPTVAFDSLIQPHWSESERTNAQKVHRFVKLLMNDHDFEAVEREFGGSRYTQHNRTMTDGLGGVLASVGRLVSRFPEFSYEAKQIVSSGDRVVVFSHATLRSSDRGDDRKGMIIFDMWQVDDGVLVEHWDSLQGLDLQTRLVLATSGGKIRNENGPF